MSPILKYLRLDKLVLHLGTREYHSGACIVPDCVSTAFSQGFNRGLPVHPKLERVHYRCSGVGANWREATIGSWRKEAQRVIKSCTVEQREVGKRDGRHRDEGLEEPRGF